MRKRVPMSRDKGEGVDVLYLTWNRLEFTEFSLRMLLENTDWSLVRNLVIHDDGSDDTEGMAALLEWAAGRVEHANVPVEMKPWDERFGSPPAVMNWYLEHFGDSERFAKVDSDIVVPPGWLGDLLDVVEAEPRLELLGMEAGRCGPPGHNGRPWEGVYGWQKCSHIGGVGLMKTESFRIRPSLVGNSGRFGFTEWQHEYEPVRGWIDPDLLVSELTRIPFDPWVSLSAGYKAKDWERDWPKYHERWDYWWSWWPK
jgi:hypothetical protein